MKIAVVDDSKEDAQHLVAFLEKFQIEKNITFQTKIFFASIDFLEEYQGEYDVIFLDIEMPGCNGLEVAREIRAKDKSVGIIFVTCMAQYAIEGYEVSAIDFMIKPVGYYNFSIKIENAFRFYQRHKEQNILITNKDGILRIFLSELIYVEKERDFLIFHTKSSAYRERGSIKSIKEKIVELSFSECTSGCLVNLNFVKRIGKNSIILISGVELPLSRRLKKQFSEDFIKYMGGL